MNVCVVLSVILFITRAGRVSRDFLVVVTSWLGGMPTWLAIHHADQAVFRVFSVIFEVETSDPVDSHL